MTVTIFNAWSASWWILAKAMEEKDLEWEANPKETEKIILKIA